jgi:hypothetical protein
MARIHQARPDVIADRGTRSPRGRRAPTAWLCFLAVMLAGCGPSPPPAGEPGYPPREAAPASSTAPGAPEGASSPADTCNGMCTRLDACAPEVFDAMVAKLSEGARAKARAQRDAYLARMKRNMPGCHESCRTFYRREGAVAKAGKIESCLARPCDDLIACLDDAGAVEGR